MEETNNILICPIEKHREHLFFIASLIEEKKETMTSQEYIQICNYLRNIFLFFNRTREVVNNNIDYFGDDYLLDTETDTETENESDISNNDFASIATTEPENLLDID